MAFLKRIGGCNIVKGIMGILFEDYDTIPIRILSECNRKLSRTCSQEHCPRYRIGTVGTHKVSWDNPGASM